MRPRRGDVERQDLGPLVGWSQIRAGDGIGLESSVHIVILLVVGVGGLEPRACESEIKMQCVILRQHEIKAVEDVFYVAVRMKDDELRWINPLRFPLIEQAIHGKYGCASELCQVALRYRELDAIGRLFSNLV
jgi:hypothetical protein